MKIVIDTNVFISGVLWNGPPSKVLDLIINKSIEAVASEKIIAEYREEIIKVAEKVSKTFSDSFLNMLLNEFSVIHVNETEKICRDPDDNMFLNCARDGKCIYIVSGDKDLLDIKMYKDIEIMTPKDFLDKYNHRTYHR